MTNVHIATLFDTPPAARLRAEDYIAAPQSAHKSDLIEGVFVTAAPSSLTHAQIAGFLQTTLSIFVSRYDLGEVLGPKAAYKLNDENVFQPDISFIQKERLQLIRDIYVDGPPDIAVEVVAPSSRHYDYIEKRINYSRFGVREYWIVDPIERAATVYEQVQGEWIPVRTEAGVLRSKVLDGFWLRLDWLFLAAGETRPSGLEVARQQGLI